MTSQVLNFDVEGLIRGVSHTPAQHKLVPNLKFSEVWLHAQDVTLSAVKSRPKDEEYNQMLLKSYVKRLVAAQELADLHRRSSPCPSRSVAPPALPCTTSALPMSETALANAQTTDGHFRCLWMAGMSSLAGSRAICHRLPGTMCTDGSPGSTMHKRCCEHGVLRQAWDSVWRDAPRCAHSSTVSTRTLWRWKMLGCAWRCGSTMASHQTTQTGDRSCRVEQSCGRSLMPGSLQNSPVVTAGACGRLCCKQDVHTRKKRPPR